MAIHVCFKYMVQMFHLFQTYIASVLSGCSICCSGYTYMLQMYVSPCFSMLQQVLLPTLSDSRASTRYTRCPFTTRHGPAQWSMQPSQRMCMRAVLPPSLALGTRAVLSLFLAYWGTRAMIPLSLVSGHVCCALSHWGTHAMFSLSHIAGRAHAHALSSRRNIVGGGVRCSSSRRRHVFKKKSKRRRMAHQVQHTWGKCSSMRRCPVAQVRPDVLVLA
jgi:hypothetical protein